MDLMPLRSLADYTVSVKQLLPAGEFWDRQLADPDSHVSVWCAVKAEELYRFKQRKNVMLAEAFPASADLLIGSWERVSGIDNSTLELDQRRTALKNISVGSINPSQMSAIVGIYGASLSRIRRPFTPAMFGRTRFGSRMATPAAFCTFWLYIGLPDAGQQVALENLVTAMAPSNFILSFIYGS